MKQIIASSSAPGAIGPYSQAVRAGNSLYISGQIPIDPATGEFAGSDIVTQTRQSLKNIGEILKAAGMDYGEYAKFFETDCPARAAFEVGALPKGALVEIEAVAYKE